MIVHTVHLRSEKPPVLVREGFSWGALVFGPFWLLARGAWLPALLLLAASIFCGVLAPAKVSWILQAGLAVFAGFAGHDLRRWSLDLHGWRLAHVIAARDEESALARLLTVRPDLADRFA